MPKTSLLLFLLATLSIGCSSSGISTYQNEVPPFRLEAFFNGKATGWGIVLNRNNRVIKRFKVEVEGIFSKDNLSGKLIENFIWSDGKKEKRTWELKKLSDNKWNGKSDGVVGTAHGIIAGNALNWSYRYNILIEDSFLKELEVDFDDWMFLMEEDVLMNRAVFSKLGVRIGTVIITFKK